MAALDHVPDDQLATPEVGAWAPQKYGLVQHYAQMFSTSMKNRFPQRVYLDLFAGAGYSRVRGSQRILRASPLRALSVKDPFDLYVFCEQDEGQLSALRSRVIREFPRANVRYHHGDSNQSIEQIIRKVPVPRTRSGVLTFCFVDPFNLGQLRFTTLRRLAERRWTDFLVLVPTGMETTRWAKALLGPGNSTIDEVLDDREWRGRLPRRPVRSSELSTFLVKELTAKFESIGMNFGGYSSSQSVLNSKNRELYRLVFFSRNALGERFWKSARSSQSLQRNLDLFPGSGA